MQKRIEAAYAQVFLNHLIELMLVGLHLSDYNKLFDSKDSEQDKHC